MDLGQLLADWIDPTILAIEDALNEGVCARGPIQLVIADARGLPRENYRKVIDGYRWLVEQGCVVVLGPMISDNSLVLQDTANELGVACIGWTGAHKFASEYCFTVANGDIPTEGVMCAQWLAAQGFEQGRPVLGAGLVGQGLRRLLPRHRAAARPHGHARGEARAQPARACVDDLAHRCATSASRASTTAATATPRSTSPTAFKALDWDPPRVMGTAFMFYSNSQQVGRGPRGLARRRPARRGRRQPQLQRHDRALREALRPHDPQRRRRPRLRHRPGRHPRHRQRRHPRARAR